MKISYGITVCNELKEIKTLLPLLIEHKRVEDEIIVLYDEKNGKQEVLDYLLPFNKLPNVQTWRGMVFVNDFAIWKNKLNGYCSGDYIFQLDADELITKELIQGAKTYSLMPEDDGYCIIHEKTIERQERQNNLYSKITK